MIIYLVHCTANGKLYVGQTRMSLDRRWWHHVKAAKAGRPWLLSRAIRLYGADHFYRHVIATVATKAELDALEAAVIAEFESAHPLGYNMMAGGAAPTHSTETRAKLRAAGLGRKHSAETLAKMRGRKHTTEELAKMSAAHSGYRYRPESLVNFGVAQRGRTYSDETRARMSSAAKARAARDGFAVRQQAATA